MHPDCVGMTDSRQIKSRQPRIYHVARQNGHDIEVMLVTSEKGGQCLRATQIDEIGGDLAVAKPRKYVRDKIEPQREARLGAYKGVAELKPSAQLGRIVGFNSEDAQMG